VGLHGREISPSQGRYQHTGQHNTEKRTPTFMPQVGFEPTTLILERAKTVHALRRAATVIGTVYDVRERNPFRALDKIEFILGKYGSKQELTVQFSFSYEI
jgi:hypothetical protein